MIFMQMVLPIRRQLQMTRKTNVLLGMVGGRYCCISGCQNGAGMHSVIELQGRYEIHPETGNEPWMLYICNNHFELENRIYDFSSTTEPQMPKQLTQLACSICHQSKVLYNQNNCNCSKQLH